MMYMIFCVIVLCAITLTSGDYDLQILHINDFHARFEPINAEFSNKCVPGTEETCIGGISRIFSLSSAIKSTSDNTIFLNAGDNFQGTLWYSMFKWNVTAQFMRQLLFDAHVVGNHDFDDGVSGLIPFLKTMNYTAVVANVDTSKEPEIAPLIQKSIIIEKGGKKIGIIGYVLESFPEISETGNLTFSDEAEAVNKEAKKLKEQGVDILIALSHAGIEKDIEVAEKVDLLDIIVGGHSHTFMYTGDPPSYDVAKYPYPLVVNQTSGRRVLIVQASAYSKYLGNLTVKFDDEGEVKAYGGNPILLGKKASTDVRIDSELQPWKKDIDLKGNVVVGYSNVDLQVSQGVCYYQECNMGNFVTDGMVYSYVKQPTTNGWSQAAVAVINSGGLRTSIEKGNITYADVLAVIPFSSTIDAVSINGSTIIEAIEYTITSNHFLQWSGVEMTIDPQQPEGKRVLDMKIVCTDCQVPELKPLEYDKFYRVMMPSFLYQGGDGYTMFTKGHDHVVGAIDTDVFFDFLSKSNHVTTGEEERIKLVSSIKNPRNYTLIFG